MRRGVYCRGVETKCIGGRLHGEFVTVDEPAFARKYLSEELALALSAPDALPSQFGYCATCHTAMRWDPTVQRIVDWPEGNTVPHCSYCGGAIVEGAHYLADINVNIDTYMGPYHHPVRFVHANAPIREAVACGPLCLIYMILGDRFRDVFAR